VDEVLTKTKRAAEKKGEASIVDLLVEKKGELSTAIPKARAMIVNVLTLVQMTNRAQSCSRPHKHTAQHTHTYCTTSQVHPLTLNSELHTRSRRLQKHRQRRSQSVLSACMKKKRTFSRVLPESVLQLALFCVSGKKNIVHNTQYTVHNT
jgi:hypothetical protein